MFIDCVISRDFPTCQWLRVCYREYPDGNEGVTSSRLARKQLIFILKGCLAVKEEEAKRNSLPLGLNVLRCNVVTVASARIFSKRHLRAWTFFFNENDVPPEN